MHQFSSAVMSACTSVRGLASLARQVQLRSGLPLLLHSRTAPSLCCCKLTRSATVSRGPSKQWTRNAYKIELVLLPRSIMSSQWCGFYTSRQQQIHPFLWMVIKPLAKAASIVTGRSFRKWWKELPEDHRASWKQHFRKHQSLLWLGGCLLVAAGAIHYFTHINEAPITHRRRYLAFTHEQFMKLAEFEYSMQLTSVEDHLVPPTHPVYQRVVNVVKRLVDSNQDLEFMRQQTWTILVVDSQEMNAFVLPTGHIFVHTGLLKFVESDSQLAVVLGHEISHALLSHAAEQVSFAAVLDVFIIIVMAAIWAFMPTDGIAIVTQWFYNKVVQLMLHLPYNRRLEEEADEVGLTLMAKACYDVRESSAFWNKMALNSELVNKEQNVEPPQWLSTHPNHENRAAKLDALMPEAEKLRLACKCPTLPSADPRAGVAYVRQLISAKNAAEGA